MNENNDITTDADVKEYSNIVDFLMKIQKAKADFSALKIENYFIDILSHALFFDGMMKWALDLSNKYRIESIYKYWFNDLFIMESILGLFIQENINNIEFYSKVKGRIDNIIIGIVDNIETNMNIARAQAIGNARAIARSGHIEREIYIVRNRAIKLVREINMDVDMAITITELLKIDIAIEVVFAIAIKMLVEYVPGIDLAQHDNSTIIDSGTFSYLPLLIASQYAIILKFRSEINSASDYLEISYDKKNIIPMIHKIVIGNMTDNKKLFASVRDPIEELAAMHILFVKVLYRVFNMREDFHFIMDCFKTLSWNPKMSDTNIGSMRDVTRKVIIERTVKHSDAIMFLKELGLPGKKEMYPNKREEKIDRINMKEDYIGAAAKKELDQMEGFDRVFDTMLRAWGMDKFLPKKTM